MKRREEGFTGIEVVIVVIMIFIFISLIASTVYKTRTTKKETDIESKAIMLAINEIEEIKMGTFYYYLGKGNNIKNEILIENQEIVGNQGFFKTILVTDYKKQYSELYPQSQNQIEADIVKKITVRVSYRYKGEIKNVELSTVKTKEN